MKKITVLILGTIASAVLFSGCLEKEHGKKGVYITKDKIQLQLKGGINDKKII